MFWYCRGAQDNLKSLLFAQTESRRWGEHLNMVGRLTHAGDSRGGNQQPKLEGARGNAVGLCGPHACLHGAGP